MRHRISPNRQPQSPAERSRFCVFIDIPGFPHTWNANAHLNIAQVALVFAISIQRSNENPD